MRVTITVTDDHGETFDGEVDLAPATSRRGGRARARAKPASTMGGRIDFGVPLRAFLMRHARGTGAQNFAVLLAHMTGGKTDVQVPHSDLEAAWARNKGVLGGGYARVYATRSKGEGWSDSPKRGTFVLRPEWRGALATS